MEVSKVIEEADGYHSIIILKDEEYSCQVETAGGSTAYVGDDWPTKEQAIADAWQYINGTKIK